MTDTVHVVTDLGPTDGPGFVVAAELLGNLPRPRFSWAPYIAKWEAAFDQRIASTLDNPGDPA